MNNRYSKCGIRVLYNAQHKIMAATDSRMYDYFPTNDSILHMPMIASGLYMVSKSPKSVKVMKETVKCALIEDCMGPPNSTTSCVYKDLWKGVYANCHRYDQSALALSLAQCSANVSDYLRVSDRVYVKRIWFNDPKEWVELKKMFPWIEQKV